MKISKITYHNFRNFYGDGEICFDTNGKINVVYGLNGDGKTTFHQLFQWAFYGEVHFNKTSDRGDLFNNQSFKELNPGDPFTVSATVEFEHVGEFYSLSRELKYIKGNYNSINGQPTERLKLLKKNASNDWIPVSGAQEAINKFLPKSLSQYFFFEGEGMVSDLKSRGSYSAASLRNGIYYLFDLQLFYNAINHIGDTSKNTTVLGKLYVSKAENSSSSSNLKALEKLVSEFSTAMEDAQQKMDALDKEIKERTDKINELYEQIGGTKSQDELNEDRRKAIQSKKTLIEELEKAKKDFGETVSDVYSRLLVANQANKAKRIIFSEKIKDKLPKGLNRELINYLLETNTCICKKDEKLSKEERERLSDWLAVLPPNSYQSIYEEYLDKSTELISKANDNIEKVDSKESSVINLMSQIREMEQKIEDIDEELSSNSSKDDLIKERKELEKLNEEDKEAFKNESNKYNKAEIGYKSASKKFDAESEKVGFNDSITKKIEIMTDLRDYYKDYLQRKSLECRESLANEIDNYLAQILTTNRNVSLSENFELKVTDEYGDEYKSEGQFAVVAFAYIMGILKTLKKFGEDKLPKEYPLVLDGPFSKLDRVQETGVLKYLPESAPQVIIFSKDDLSSFVPQNNFGTVCIIESNISKNMSKIVKANAEQVKYFFSEERANKLQNEKLKMKGYEN